jgi:hypothetical protein
MTDSQSSPVGEVELPENKSSSGHESGKHGVEITAISKDPLKNRLFEWVWRGSTISTLMKKQAENSEQQMRLGWQMIEMANQLQSDADSVLEGNIPWLLAIHLYREGLNWCVRGQFPEPLPSWPELLETEQFQDIVTKFAPKEPVPSCLGWATVAEGMKLTFSDQQRVCRELQSWTNDLHHKWDSSHEELVRYRGQRWFRTTIVGGLMLVFLITIGSIGKSLWDGPDLARGRPFRASSYYPGFSPTTTVAAENPFRVLFHTREENSPWFEIDLQMERKIRSVWVSNRPDEYGDRALPLILEISSDRKSWMEIAKRDQSFFVWKPRFATKRARYVRLRTPRKTSLHLVKVEVH